MKMISEIYNKRRSTGTTHDAQYRPISFVAEPLDIEHAVTRTGRVMTRLSFVIRKNRSVLLGSNIEPLLPINELLQTVPHLQYQQCSPLIPLEKLVPIKLCIPFNEIAATIQMISTDLSRISSSVLRDVNVLRTCSVDSWNIQMILKGWQEGINSTG